jgi:7-cyano-7-deazaguanine reductase
MNPDHPSTAPMHRPELSTLGQPVAYPAQYSPSLLYPLPRAPKRDEIGVTGALPFMGADFWTAYELSWLNPRGKPQLAIAQVTVPCETPHMVESKSFKLYLNGFNASVFDSAETVQQRLREDLTAAVWHGQEPRSSVGVRLLLPAQWEAERVVSLDGLSLDRLDVECTDYQPAPQWLQADDAQPMVQEVLVSDLLKSNCLVTGQPDWGSVQIAYSGAPIDQAGLLRYLVSFRDHPEFHEQCVERIFTDLWQRCRPTRLSVLARYTRRGGLDINPWRTSHPQRPPAWARTARQ